YEITAESAGFQTEVRRGVTLTVGREAVVDFTLNVGAVAERITVTGEAPLIETTSSTVAGLISETQMRELPLNARSYEQLALLEPNVYLQRNTTRATNIGLGAPLSSGGMRTTFNYFVVDGIDAMDVSNNTPGSAAGQLMGVETLREFRVITNNAPAQYGRAMGAIVDVSSRSGTNELHGTVFEFLRNNAMDARSFFDAETAPLKRNQFGFVLGGPVKQDKAFFFGSYEALRTRLTDIRQLIVPTPDGKLGRLGTRTVTVNPAVVPYLRVYPNTDKDLGDGFGQVAQAFPSRTREDFFTGRIDYQHSDSTSYFVRYNYDNVDKQSPRVGANVLPWQENLRSNNHMIILAETRLLSPQWVNEFRAGFVRATPRSKSSTEEGQDPLKDLKFACCVGAPIIQLGATSFQSSSIQLAAIGSTGRQFENYTGNHFSYADNLSYASGSHSVKLGGILERFQDNLGNPTESLYYQNPSTYQLQSLEELLTGRPRSFSGTIVPSANGNSGRQWLYGLYVQDDWRILNNLTLNLGVRYEWASNYESKNNRFAVANVLGGTVMADRKYQWDGRVCAGCLDPRFGFAWDMFSNSRTVLKGGFGVYRSQIVRFFANTTGGASQGDTKGGGVTMSVTNPSFPDARIPRDSTTRININPERAPTQAGILPPVPSTPSALQWNLTVERSITPSTNLRLAYVGNHGYHLDTSVLPNQNRFKICPDATEPRCTTLGLGPDTWVFPATGTNLFVPSWGNTITETRYDFNSYYNGFTATLGQRYTRGMDFQLTYGFSRATDDVTSARASGYAVASEPYMVDWRRHVHHALSGYDMRHRFVTNFGYEFPSFTDMGGAANKLLSGWKVAGILTAQAGTPLTALIGFDQANALSQRPVNSQRPGISGPVKLCPCTLPASLGGGTQSAPERWFDPTVFVLPARGTYGNAGRNIITGPGLTTLDMSMTKNTYLTERLNLQFRAEAFNVVNHANFAMPSSRIFETDGRITPTAGLINRTFTDGRQFQFALKLIF
ncbi:MAG: TonB-dependent receptor, partial [Acidobacteria bacterium]|nr:TonB-dependent receptor [Acidobacteriota bacterium]